MTHEKSTANALCQAKIDKLAADVATYIRRYGASALASAGISDQDRHDETYLLANAIVTAAMEELRDTYEPLDSTRRRAFRRNVRNIVLTTPSVSWGG